MESNETGLDWNGLEWTRLYWFDTASVLEHWWDGGRCTLLRLPRQENT
jgi:hypothetical protein